MSAVIGWGVLVGYLLAGLKTARVMHLRWYRQDGQPVDEFDASMWALAALGLGLIWPLVLLFFGMRRVVEQPAVRWQERQDQLRADRAEWQRKTYSRDPEEQRMAQEILKVLDDAIDAERRRGW